MIDRFYLITSNVDALKYLVPLGVKLVQLRLKNIPEPQLRQQIKLARDICRNHGAQLVVNDYWQIALDLGCDCVHLGQEDMDEADFKALKRAGETFGLSTHDQVELDRALSFDPHYIALGPVYKTVLKQMKWAPQGLEKLRDWKTQLGNTPLVAIGGLTPARIPAVFAAGADSVAVVSDIQTAKDPISRTQEWMNICHN